MVNVFNFGAAGDGQVDDTEALQHALEAGDGVLSLNPGTYRISRPLVLDTTKQGYVGIRGAAGTSRIIMTGPGPAIRLIGSHEGTATPSTVKPQVWEKERLPIISDLEILGEHPEAVGIELRKTMQATVSRVLIRQCLHALHLVERNRNFLLADSHLYDCHSYGVFFDRCNLHQTIICGNHISYCHRAGIKSLDGDVHNLHITGNDIEYNNRPGEDESPNGEPTGAEIWFEAREGTISEVTIASNTIQATVQPGGANIRVYGSADSGGGGARLISISGNVIGSQSRAIDLEYADRVAITGNTIYDSPDLSLRAIHCEGLSFGSNTVCWRGTPETPPKDGILLEHCTNAAITGLATRRMSAGSAEAGGAITLRKCDAVSVGESQILDPLHRGIELEDCTRCRVTANTILDDREPHTMQQAIRVTGNSRGNLIQGNLVGGAAQQNIAVDEKANHVAGNSEV